MKYLNEINMRQMWFLDDLVYMFIGVCAFFCVGDRKEKKVSVSDL